MISVSHWRERGKCYKVKGYNIFVIDEGETGDPHQETIIMIHGFPTSSRDWCQIWPLIDGEPTKARRLIALDLLGFGVSQKPRKHKYTIMEQADIVEAIIKQKRVNQFHILAHDYGDTVAQELLARQNANQGVGKWLSCCLLNGGLFAETHRPLLEQKILSSPIGFIFNALITRNIFIKSLSKTFSPENRPDSKDMSSFWELVNYNGYLMDFHRLIKYMKERVTHKKRWRDALSESDIPLAIINGSADPISGSHMVDYYLQEIGAPSYLARLENIGHYLQLEAPQAVADHYLKFLSHIENNKY